MWSGWEEERRGMQLKMRLGWDGMRWRWERRMRWGWERRMWWGWEMRMWWGWEMQLGLGGDAVGVGRGCGWDAVPEERDARARRGGAAARWGRVGAVGSAPHTSGEPSWEAGSGSCAVGSCAMLCPREDDQASTGGGLLPTMLERRVSRRTGGTRLPQVGLV